MASHVVKLVSDGTPEGTKILVDGKSLDNVTAVVFTVGLAARARVTVELLVDEVDIEGDVEVETTTDAYVRPEPTAMPGELGRR